MNRNINSFLESSADSIIDVPWTVACSDQYDLALLSCADSIHPGHQFSLDLSTGLIISLAPFGGKRIDLINEDSGGTVELGHLK